MLVTPALTQTVQTVLLAGVGGQGIVLAGDVLAEAALLAGFDVKKSEIHGLSRRFGSVACQVRFGRKALSPLCGHGSVDLLVALEIQEGLRNLPYLRPQGTALVNRLWVAANGAASPRPPDDLECQADARILWLEGTQEVHEVQAVASLNFFMLGALSHYLPLGPLVWRAAMKQALPPRLLDVNHTLFAAGLRAVRAAS
jgi:indolepyruvate ferredoxin oxidoreductase beta subunit